MAAESWTLLPFFFMPKDRGPRSACASAGCYLDCARIHRGNRQRDRAVKAYSVRTREVQNDRYLFPDAEGHGLTDDGTQKR